MTNPSTTAQLLCVDTALLGLNRGDRFKGYQVHPLIRNNWSSADPLRDSLGFVAALYSSTAGPNAGITRVDERVYWGLSSENAGFASPWEYLYQSDIDAGIDRLYDEVYDATAYAIKLISVDPYRPLGFDNREAEKGSFSLHFNKEEWNLLITASYVEMPYQENMQSLLEQEMPGTAFSGRPYFVKYFADSITGDMDTNGLVLGDPRMAGATEGVPPMMEGLLVPEADYLFDHTFERTLRLQVPEGSYNIEISPVYNFYLDTSPDYEPTVLNLPESMLPNYYMIETNYTLAPANNGMVPYTAQTGLIPSPGTTLSDVFLQATSSNVQLSTDYQQISEGYFQYYMNRLDYITWSNELETTKTTFESVYKNVAVLSPEIAGDFLGGYNIRRSRATNIESDALLARTTYPFYNEIKIPYTNQYPAGNNFFTDVASDSTEIGAEQLLTLMQLMITYSYISPLLTGSTGRTTLGFTMADKHADPPRAVVDTMPVDVLINLEDFLNKLMRPTYDENFSSIIDNLINFYDTGTSPSGEFNFNILKEGFVGLLGQDENSIGSYFDSFEANKTQIIEAAATSAANRFRKFSSFFRGRNTTGYQNCVSEPIMYVVEKRVAGAADPLVQTLFFGRDIMNQNKKGVVYYDTQIKYGVQYLYTIKQVRLVFGNKYRYNPNTTTVVTDTARQQGRAVGNALGFFAPQNPHFVNSRAYAKIVDSPRSGLWTPDLSITTTGNDTSTNGAYISEDGEGVSNSMNGGSKGYYVYRWNRRTTGDLYNLWGDPATYTNEEAARAGIFTWDDSNSKILMDSVDWTQIPLVATTGEGFASLWNGGMIPGLITITELPPEAEVPETTAHAEEEKEYIDYGTDWLARINSLVQLPPTVSYGATRKEGLLDFIEDLLGFDEKSAAVMWLWNENYMEMPWTWSAPENAETLEESLINTEMIVVNFIITVLKIQILRSEANPSSASVYGRTVGVLLALGVDDAFLPSLLPNMGDFAYYSTFVRLEGENMFGAT